MIKKIQNMIMAIVLPFAFAAPVAALTTSVAFADTGCTGIAKSVAGGANSTTSGSVDGDCDTSGLSDDSVGSIGKEVVTIFSEIVGVISIIMIVYGGFRYITSGGDSGKVGNAKNTIIYAIVGLIIVALAQAIVHYVLNTSSTITTS